MKCFLSYLKFLLQTSIIQKLMYIVKEILHEVTNMEVSYNKLWKLMIDRNMNKSELRELTGIGTNTLAKLSKNQAVSMEVLMKICNTLNCDISDICEFIKQK